MATEMQLESRAMGQTERLELISDIAGEMAAGIVNYKKRPTEKLMAELMQLVADYHDVLHPDDEEDEEEIKEAEKERMKRYAANFTVGQTVRYYGLMNPRGDLEGEAKITMKGTLSNEPVVWLEGVGAYHIDAIEAI